MAVGIINEAIDKGSTGDTLEALLNPTAKLQHVEETHASHYQNLLSRCKREKAKVGAA